jgi:hypothetical protein
LFFEGRSLFMGLKGDRWLIDFFEGRSLVTGWIGDRWL